MTQLSREEFLTHIDYVRADLRGVNEHLAQLNGRTRENEKAIARSEEAISTNKADIALLEARTGSAPGIWAGGIAGLVFGVAEGLKWFFSK